VFASVVAERAIPYRLVADGRRLRAVVAVEDWSQLRDLAATVEREYGGFDLRRTTELERPGGPLGRDDLEYGIRGKLTADQLEILRTAYEMGHFAVPQQATSTEVAEALDIGRSTFSERIRRSQNNLLRVLFSDVE
jgi:predicted DNA binding protein